MEIINSLITPEVEEIIRLIVLVSTLVHALTGLLLFRQIMSVSSKIYPGTAGLVRLVSLVHVCILVGILLLVVFY